MEERTFKPDLDKDGFIDCYCYITNIQIQLEMLQDLISDCRNSLVYSALGDQKYDHVSRIHRQLLSFQTLIKDLGTNYNRLNKAFDSK